MLSSIRPTSQAQSAKKGTTQNPPGKFASAARRFAVSSALLVLESRFHPAGSQMQPKLKVELNQKKKKYAKANLLRKTG
jgi:hypothetical protein